MKQKQLVMKLVRKNSKRFAVNICILKLTEILHNGEKTSTIPHLNQN